jgi:hypothetical protein
VTHRWAASVGYTGSGLPFLGEVRDRVWAAGGYCGTGNVIGALCGRAAAARALGQEHPGQAFERLTALDRLQRVGQRHPLGRLAQPPLPQLPLHHLAGKRLPRHALVLDELGQLEPCLEQGCDDLSHPVVPGLRALVREDAVGLDIGSVVDELDRVGRLAVRVAQHQQAVVALLIHGPQHRRRLPQEQPPPGSEQPRDHRRPAAALGSQHRAPMPVKTRS